MRRTTVALGLSLSIAGALAACQVAPASNEKLPKSARCATCHLAEYEGVTHPMHPGKKPKTCGVCHKETSWSPAIKKHAWELTGKHAKADCFACHDGKPPVYEGTPDQCVDCHRDDFVHVKFPEHAKFSTKCDECHTTSAWKPTKEDAPAHPTPKKPEPKPDPTPVPTETPKPTPTATVKPKPTPTVLVPQPKPQPQPQPKPWPDPPDTSSGASPRH